MLTCAQGVARQRQAIVNGLRDSILNFSSDVHDVNSKDVIEMMMVTQYFDMLRDIGGHGRRAHAICFQYLDFPPAQSPAPPLQMAA